MPRFYARPYTNSISFDGSSSFLTKASPTGINNGTNGDLTVSGWVFLRDNNIATLFELHRSGGTGIAFSIGQSAGSYIYFSDRINGGNNRGMTATQFNNLIGIGRWRFVTYVLTSTTVTMYVDGASLGTGAAFSTPINAGTANALFLGKGQTTGNVDIQFFNGVMKDWRAFNAALSATEVADLYFKNAVPSSCVGRWLMGEGSGTSVADSVGSNSLTATSPTWSTFVPTTSRSAVSPANYRANITHTVPFTIRTAPVASGGISVANASSLNPTSAVTVECWFKYGRMQGGILLFDNSNVGTTSSYYVSIKSDGSLQWYSEIGGVSKNITSTTTKLGPNKWHFISATFTGSAIYLYANGQKLSEEITGLSGSLGTNPGPLYLARYYSGLTSLTLNGMMYRPRVYNVGCTLTEHQERYYAWTTPSTLQAGLVMDLAMTAGTGSTLTDVSGQGNNGTLLTGASWEFFDVPANPRVNIRDLVACYNNLGGSTSHYTTFAHDSTLNISAGAVCAWVYRFPGSSSSNLAYISKRQNPGIVCSYAFFIVGDGKIGFYNGSAFLTTTKRVPTNTWVHVTANGDSSTCDFYVNGRYFETIAQGYGSNNTHDLYVGCSYPGSEHFQGMVDDVRIFTSGKLTAAQCADLYYRNVNPSTPAHWWKFDEGSGTSVADSTGAITGTQNNSAAWSTNVAIKPRTYVT